MIRLKDLLQEFEYGRLLWADPAYASSSGKYRAFIDKAYKGAMEKDSAEEAQLWTQLQYYLKHNQKDGLDLKAFAELARMKADFPAILEPGLRPDDMVYRGMTIPLEQAVELVADPKVFVVPRSTDWYTAKPVDRNIESRSKGFISVSSDRRLAAGFVSTGRSYPGRWPVITCTPYSAIADKAFMNPDFLTAVGGYEEQEVWVLGQALPVTELQIRSPWFFGPANSREAKTMEEAFAARGFYRGHQSYADIF
jgi:hypothetical protein